MPCHLRCRGSCGRGGALSHLAATRWREGTTAMSARVTAAGPAPNTIDRHDHGSVVAARCDGHTHIATRQLERGGGRDGSRVTGIIDWGDAMSTVQSHAPTTL